MSLIHEWTAEDDRVLYDEVQYFSVYDQCWSKEAIQELRDKHNIIFMSSGDGCIPVMIIPRDSEPPLVALGVEDDGTLYFKRNSYGRYANSFDSSWIDSMIADLQAAKAKINEGGKVISEKEHQQYEALRNEVKGMGYSDRVRGHRIENPLTDLPLVLPGEVLTTSEMEAIIKPIKEESK